mgnify:CR=1 FL=1
MPVPFHRNIWHRLKEWYGCIEANPYQQGWFVPHDIPGMVNLMGGKEKVIADLTDFFNKTPSNMLWNEYYNHANEPVHFVPFLFNQLEVPWYTQKWTRYTCEKAYANKVEGIVGNEDVGQMSAWYVLAASGIHPSCPGNTRMDDEKTIFYTAMYHTMIDPRIYTDVDGRYVGGDYKIHTADSTFTKRTIFSGWDVFRSQFPLQTIINPRLVSDELNSLITMADQSGREYYERWELLNSYSGCMLGNPALSVLADAYIKGIRTYDAEKAYRYAINTSRRFGNDSLGYAPEPLSISTDRKSVV